MRGPQLPGLLALGAGRGLLPLHGAGWQLLVKQLAGAADGICHALEEVHVLPAEGTLHQQHGLPARPVARVRRP